MSTEQKKPALDDTTIEITLLVVVVGLAATCGWLSAKAGAELADKPAPPGDPVTFLIDLLKGRYTWPGEEATVIAVTAGIVLVLLTAAAFRLRRHLRRPKPAAEGATGPAPTPAPGAAPATPPGTAPGTTPGTGPAHNS